MIPYGSQDLTDADIDAVVAVRRSDSLTQGSAVPRLEQAVAARCDTAHGVAVNSATIALHLACLALSLGPGDGLGTSPNTFVASANCGRYCGARVSFIDIDPRTFARRRALAGRYDRLLADLPVVTPFRDPVYRSALHLYPIQINPIQISDLAGRDRGQVFADLRQAGIWANIHCIPVHTQPDYQRLGFQPGDFPIAEAYYQHAISLPLYPSMNEKKQDQVINCLERIGN